MYPSSLSMASSQPIQIFVCYAHADNEGTDPNKRWLDRLLEQLAPLSLQEQALIWSDQKLEIGDTWHKEIQNVLQQVKAAVLLISPAFLKSKYIRNSEVPILLKRAKDEGLVVLPIILRPCLFKETTFKYPDAKQGPEELSLSVFQAPNSVRKPLNGLQEHEQDQILLEVAKRLLKIIKGPQAFTESKSTSRNVPSLTPYSSKTTSEQCSEPESPPKAGITQNNKDSSTGFQTLVQGGTANIGQEIHIVQGGFYQPSWKVEKVYQSQEDSNPKHEDKTPRTQDNE